MTDVRTLLGGSIDTTGLDRLFRQRAHAADVVDVAYEIVASPVGPLLVAATREGLVRLAYECEDHEAVLLAMSRTVSPRLLRAPGRLADAARQLDEYFSGRRKQFELPLDLRVTAGFRRAVLEAVRGIGYGATASYAAVAGAAGSPRAVRAVGTACGHNPLPLVIPCHRVVRSDGTPGGYVGGSAAKAALLLLER